jgi:hypothetical protein
MICAVIAALHQFGEDAGTREEIEIGPPVFVVRAAPGFAAQEWRRPRLVHGRLPADETGGLAEPRIERRLATIGQPLRLRPAAFDRNGVVDRHRLLDEDAAFIARTYILAARECFLVLVGLW